MSGEPRNLMSMPGVPSVVEELCTGRLRWDLIHPFPAQDDAQRQVGDTAVEEIIGFLVEHVDPEAVDTTATLPDGLVEGLRSRGYLGLMVDPDLGGLGLSPFNAFRVVEAAASWSMAVALLLATQNGIGAGPFAQALPPGPLRDFLRARVAEGAVSGVADTEPSGQANASRQTTAIPTEDGTAYLLTGEKVHISNAPIADVLAVTATVSDQGAEQSRLFFTGTRVPGFQADPPQEFMGVKGFPAGRLRLDGVRVPREHMLVEEAQGRHTPELTFLLVRGRLHIVVAPSAALAKRCLAWSREFALRRTVDGQAVGGYDAVRRMLADSLADVFAIDSVAEWVMLAGSGREQVNPLLEQLAAKNIASLACWRVVDRSMSLMAAEGFETARSKGRRGVPPTPMERAFRDARGLRIWGGVDFQLDNWFSRLVTFTYYYPEPENAAAIDEGGGAAEDFDTAGLSARNRAHLLFVAEQARAFARTCLRLSRRHPDPEKLFVREGTLVLTNQILGELLTMALVLARAARLSTGGQCDVQDVADVYCSAARHRLGDWWRRLDDDGEPDHAGVAARWLDGGDLDLFARDVVRDTPLVVAP